MSAVETTSTTLDRSRRSGRSRAPRQKTVRFHKVTSADGTVIEAWSNTAEGPTVLICNGLGTNPYVWPELLDPDCGLHVISWNHRGVGRSARPEDASQVGIDAFVEDAVAVLDDAGVDRCVVAGWSMGVNTAFELALRHPERVAGLFAVAGVPGGTFASMGAPLMIPRPLREPISVNVARLMKLGGPLLTPVARRIPMGPVSTTVLRYSGFMFPTAKPDVVRRAVREFLTTPVDWYGHLAVSASAHRRVSLSKLDVPASFVAGRWDLLASHRDMRTAADQIEGATYVELLGSHFLTMEKPAAVLKLLHELVERDGTAGPGTPPGRPPSAPVRRGRGGR
ncbi:MAG TPA: alpha/beta hydrolase [Marmoricola sp.]|nr:alpha/beta hydrolase [Marmoricola sp.]